MENKAMWCVNHNDTIERIRCELNEAIRRCGDLCCDEVLAISQKLDGYIIKSMQKKDV